MFSDSELNISSFEPVPESERSVSDGNCQTDPTKTFSKETQTSGKQSLGAQTFPNQEVLGSVPFDAEKLLQFLNRVVPRLEEELKDFENCTGQIGYQNSNKNEGSDELEQTYLKHTIIEPDYCKAKVISNLSWNSTGMLIAVASCEKNHEGWCNHDTCIGIYNTGKNKFEKNQPEHLLKPPGCVRCIGFHPHVPSLLAAGCHSGEVIVWNLTNDEVLLSLVKDANGDTGHVNSVTSLVWRHNRKGESLITTGRDGRIIFWKVTLTNLTYEISERFCALKSQSLSEVYEIVHSGFWQNNETDFVIASGNCIVHCSLKTAKYLIPGSQYRNPVVFNYSPHEGVVTNVSCSHTNNLFASCGMDGKIQIYRCETATPLYVICSNKPVMGIRWISDSKHLISWGCHSKAQYHSVSLEENKHFSKTFCEIEEKISTVEKNYSREGKFAIGTITGQIVILSDNTF